MQKISTHTSLVLLLGLSVLSPGKNARAQDDIPEKTTSPMVDQEAATPEKDDKLYFSFAGSKWKDVIEWLAETSGLALHVNDLPPGSFTYSDTEGFTTQEAIDRINLFLLPEGYTLVRSGRLLSVINLTDPKSTKQIDTLARLVSVKDLADLEDHDMVKCIFPLGELKAEEAVEELSALNLLKTPDVFTKTNQILVTDTAGKIKIASQILSAFQPDTLENGTIVKSFRLDHVSAEDVLSVARPHLGLATGEMIGIDVSVSADVLGKNIFVTGIEDKVKLIEGLIREIDVEEVKKKDGNDVLQSHPVTGGNVEMVYNVLQTMMSGEEIRLSMDQTAQSIVALAPEKIQQEIADTVTQLQASEAEFAVIPLKHIDPYFVISLLEEMLDLDSTSLDMESDTGFNNESWRRGWGDRGRSFGGGGNNDRKTTIEPPKIDADPGGMKLFVLGRKSQIQQIQKIVEELDVSGSGLDDQSQLRVFPLKGAAAESAIETAARFWQGKNSLIYYPQKKTSSSAVQEKIISEIKQEARKPDDSKGSASGRILSGKLNSDLPPIQIQVTDRGILLQSEDAQALTQFEEILRRVVGPVDSVASAPIVYYLKYAKPDEAIRMLAELLDGMDSASEAEAGTLVNGIVSNSSGTFLGSLILSRDGNLTLTYGTMTVVADTRLNRLIAQGTANELERIEMFLKIIDKDRSITDIQIYGTSHLIELENVEAADVAVAVREAYFGRILGGNSSNPNQSPSSRNGNPSQSSRDRNSNDERSGDDKNGGSKPKQGQKPPAPKPGGGSSLNEPRMTIAVHEPSNSLIVTAPEPLFLEVEKLVKLIDSRSVQTVEILKVRRPLANDLQMILSGEMPLPTGTVNTGSSSTNTTKSKKKTTSKSSRLP
ncbi:MAG: secretin N-terminal domain-containing protein [Planctomycetota bacterium]|nr:secretin N-terminal domain-containing protein [Planctomycetota bacterium]